MNDLSRVTFKAKNSPRCIWATLHLNLCDASQSIDYYIFTYTYHTYIYIHIHAYVEIRVNTRSVFLERALHRRCAVRISTASFFPPSLSLFLSRPFVDLPCLFHPRHRARKSKPRVRARAHARATCESRNNTQINTRIIIQLHKETRSLHIHTDGYKYKTRVHLSINERHRNARGCLRTTNVVQRLLLIVAKRSTALLRFIRLRFAWKKATKLPAPSDCYLRPIS